MIENKFGKSQRADYTGMRFGKLTVLGQDGKRDKHGNILWKCECDCGNICYAIGSTLPKRKSCGCKAVGRFSANKPKDIVGERFGYWTVLQKTPFQSGGHDVYRCVCKCGKYADVTRGNLVNGVSKSCGCMYGRSRKRKVVLKPIGIINA